MGLGEQQITYQRGYYKHSRFLDEETEVQRD